MSEGSRGLRPLLSPRALPGPRAGPATSAHGQPRARRPLAHIPLACAGCAPAERGAGRTGVALPPPDRCPHRGSGEPDRTQRGPREIPVRFPRISALPRGPFSKIKERKPNAGGGSLAHAATGPPGQVWDHHPPFTPLFPLKNSARPPTAAPPPPRQNEAKPGPPAAAAAATAGTGVPRPPLGSDSALGRSLTHQNAHLLLAEEAGEEGGDGEAHGGSCTRDGQEQKGFGASPGLLRSRSRQAERGEELTKEEGGRGGSLAGAPGDAPGPESAGRGPARRLPRRLRL